MKKNICLSLLAIASALLSPTPASAQFPKPTYGWNMGNTMEPPSGIGAWGGSPSEPLIAGVAKAGFNLVRIPCSWDCHANKTTYQIDPEYMASVKQVVDWCYSKKLTVVINDHWDGGWLENKLSGTPNPVIDAKMKSFWTQIATTFAKYDDHLLFAAANEPNVDCPAKMAELMGYYQTFVNAVRGSGKKNSSRWLVVQGPNADIDATDKWLNTLPTDPTPRRMVVEVHFYSPYQFALMESDASWGKMFYFWGKSYHSASLPERNATWGEEEDMNKEFQKMETKFTSKGIPVILGEFRAERRGEGPELKGANLKLHVASTTYWNKCVVDFANAHGMSPICWDTPNSLFDFKTGEVREPETTRALTGGPVMAPPK